MNLLCSATLDKFWLDVMEEIEEKRGIKPVYWVGSPLSSVKPENCYVHDVWEAFALDGCVPDWENKADSFDVSKIGRSEYYNYLKILDRVDFDGGFSFSERDDLFKRHLSYWSYVLKHFEVDVVFFSNAPHMPYDYPLYLCAKIMGLKVLMFNVSSLRGWHYLTEEVGGKALTASDNDLDKREVDELHAASIEPYLFSKHQQPWYMKHQSDKQRSFRIKMSTVPYFAFLYLLSSSLVGWLFGRKTARSSFFWTGKLGSFKFYDGVYVKKAVSIFDVYNMKVKGERKKKKLKKEYDKFSTSFDPSSVGRYVYFPMHYQPELTTTPLGNESSDQFYVIRALSRSLPKGYKLVVKEHPSQFFRVLFGEQGRHVGCWELVSRLNNVVLADLSVSSISLIQNASAVVTITGTAGWEAMVNGKPCLHFGGAWYQDFPQSTKVNFSDVKSKLVAALDSETCEKIVINDVIENFGKKAIRTDIHGVLGGSLSRSSSITAGYILRII